MHEFFCSDSKDLINKGLKMNESESEIPQAEIIESNELDFFTKEKGHHRRRSSSFMKTGFASLAHNEEDEKELDYFFTADK